MDLSLLWTEKKYRVAVGLLLVFVSLVVFPSYYGVSPLSTVTTSVVLDSFSYSPDQNVLLAQLTLFRSTDTGESVTFRFTLDPGSAKAYQVTADPLEMTATNTKTDVIYKYQFAGSLPSVTCRSASGSASAGTILSGPDYARAIQDAWQNYVSTYGAPQGTYRVFATAHWENSFLGLFGGTVKATIYVCQYDPERYKLFSYKDKTLYSCFTLDFRNSKGDVVATSPICSDAVGSVITIAKSGVAVGKVIYEGYSQLTWPTDLPVSPGAYTVVDRVEVNNQPSTAVFLVDDPGKIDAYRSYTSKLSDYVVKDFGPVVVNYVSDTEKYHLAQDLENDLSNIHLVVLNIDGTDIPHAYLSLTVDALSSSLNTLKAYLSDLLSHPVSSTSYDVNRIYQNGLDLIQDLTNYPRPIVSHRVSLRLNAEFVGIHFTRPVVKILSASSPSCTDKRCEIDVRLKNDTTDPNEHGLATVYVRGTYISGQTSVSLEKPGQEVVAKVITTPTGVTKGVLDDVRIEAIGVHPVAPTRDVYNLTVTVEKTYECNPSIAYCTFDENLGRWKYTHCESYDKPPVTTVCPEDYGCSEGSGCVPDVLQSVECTGTTTYVAHYQYSGDVPGTCSADTVCDANLAAQNILPPCKARTPVPVLSRPRVSFHVVEHRTYLQDIARGLLLIGVALLVI